MVLNQDEFTTIYYGSSRNIEEEPHLSFSMHLQDPNKVQDFAQVAFVFGSSNFTFNRKVNLVNKKDNIRYIFSAENSVITPKCIENLKFSLAQDNFNFDSSNGFAKIVNLLLKDMVEPNGIGKTVSIKFTNDFYPDDDSANLTLIANEFENLEENKLDNSVWDMTLTNFASKYISYFKKISQSDIINYSANGKYVIYGDDEANTLNQITTKTGVDLEHNKEYEKLRSHLSTILYPCLPQPIVNKIIDSLLEWKDIDFNPHKNRLDNRILYLADKCSDNITGAEYNDILYSNGNT